MCLSGCGDGQPDGPCTVGSCQSGYMCVQNLRAICPKCREESGCFPDSFRKVSTNPGKDQPPFEVVDDDRRLRSTGVASVESDLADRVLALDAPETLARREPLAWLKWGRLAGLGGFDASFVVRSLSAWASGRRLRSTT